MRKELYTALCRRIMDHTEVKHVDLWNQNIMYIDQEQPWQRPAVFIEFGTADWRPCKDKVYQAKIAVKLHIVTDWAGSAAAGAVTQADALAAYDLSDRIQEAIAGVTDERTYWYRDIVQTATNHNHEEIVENIDTYQFQVVRDILNKNSCMPVCY